MYMDYMDLSVWCPRKAVKLSHSLFVHFCKSPRSIYHVSIKCHGTWVNGLEPDCSNPIVNTLRPKQDGHHFADDIFMCIFFNENCCILIKFSLKYVRNGPIDNNPALVERMAWRRSGDKPLFQPMMISLPTHICVTRPQWVNVLELLQSCIKPSVCDCT